MKHPVIDLHCDLLAHMLKMSKPDPFKREGIGCSFPDLTEGNVKLQVMAIFTATEKGSTALALRQSEIFASFLAEYPNDCSLVHDVNTLSQITTSSKIGVIAAIENASGFCEENEPLKRGFERLERIITNTKRILYIGFTHHAENRSGGGHTSTAGIIIKNNPMNINALSNLIFGLLVNFLNWMIIIISRKILNTSFNEKFKLPVMLVNQLTPGNTATI